MDLNEDGNPDILSGSYSRPGQDMAGLFQVLWGKGEGHFIEAEALNGTDDKPLVISAASEDDRVKKICTRPWAVDWDHDGDLDLLVGNFKGTFYLFEGEGKGEFKPESEVVMTEDGVELQIDGAHSDPMTVDWDGDGDLDVLSGTSQGGVQWAENTAGPDKVPSLKRFVSLIEGKGYPATGALLSEEDLDGPSNSSRVWATDYNEDGKLDLLVGDNVTLTSPADGLSHDEFEKALKKWKKDIGELGEYPASAGEEELQKWQKQMSELYQLRGDILDEQRTGYVWLFLRK